MTVGGVERDRAPKYPSLSNTGFTPLPGVRPSSLRTLNSGVFISGIRMSPDTSTTQTLSAPRWVFHLAEQVAHEHGLDLDDVTTFRTHNVGGRAKRHARQHLMYLIRNAKMLSGATPSYPMIAYWLGGLHHTTVMHGVRAHETRMKARVKAAAEKALRDAA